MLYLLHEEEKRADTARPTGTWWQGYIEEVRAGILFQVGKTVTGNPEETQEESYISLRIFLT